MLLGASFYIFGLFLDTSRDAAAKLLTADLAVAQIVTYRVAFDVMFAMLGAVRGGGLFLLWPVNPLLHVLKALAMGLAMLLIYTSLKYLPLAEVSGILLMAPIFIIIVSYVFLRESPSVQSLAAVVIGIIGGLIVIKPTSGEGGAVLLLPIAASICVAVVTVCNRSLCASNNNWAILFSAGALILITIFPMALHHWNVTGWKNTILLISIGLTGAISSYCHVHASRLVAATNLAPFDYLEWVFAVITGVLIWGDIPRLSSWFGCACIVAGTIIALKERK